MRKSYRDPLLRFNTISTLPEVTRDFHRNPECRKYKQELGNEMLWTNFNHSKLIVIRNS